MNLIPEAEAERGPAEPVGAPAGFPWPPGEHETVLDALVETWHRAVFRPVSFFAALPAELPLGAALLYYLAIGITGAAIRLFWAMLLPVRDLSYLDQLFPGGREASPLIDFLASPLYLLLSLYLAAGITHLLVLALVPRARGFGTTLRIYCFAYSPVLFGVVPYVGGVAAFAWMTALSLLGVREAHATTTGRAAAAVLVPLLLALLFLVLAYLLLTRAAGLLTVSGT